MINYFLKITFLAAIPLMLCSCVDDVVFGSKGEKIVAVNCLLKYPAQEQTVRVVTAAPVGTSSSGTPVKDAEVSMQDLSDASGTRIVFNYKSGADYRANYEVVPGHKYALEVKISGRDIIAGETTVPEAHSLTVQYGSVIRPSSSYGGYMAYTYDVNAIKGRPFWLYLTENGENPVDNKIAGLVGAMDGFLFKLEAESLDEFNVTGEYREFDGRKELLGVPTEVQDGIMVLHKKYLRFTGQEDAWRSQALWKFDRFFVYGNLEDSDYSSVQEDRVEVFPDKEKPEGWKQVAVLSVPSREYDKFLKELFLVQEKFEDMQDLTILYEMTDMYTNFSGGAKGIFGAQVVYYLPWVKPLDIYK